MKKLSALFLKMRKLCGILKHAGTHIEMGIQWESYISAATSELSRLAFAEANIELRTTPVSRSRMQAAALLEHLKFDVISPIVIGDRGILVPLYANNERYVVLYRRDRSDALTQMMNQSYQERNVDAFEYVDAFFFFLVKEFDIPLPPNVTKSDVKTRISKVKNEATIDFDAAVNFHGSFFAWKVGESTSSVEFVDLLTWQVDGQHCIGFTEDNPAYGIDRIKIAEVLDLRQLCRTVVNPIAIATDKKILQAALILPMPDLLGKALMSISPSRDDLVFGPGGGICFKFMQDEREYLALSLRNFYDFEIGRVLSALTEIGVNEVDFEYAHFLSFVFKHGQYLDISREQLSHPEDLENRLDVKNIFSCTLEDIASVYEDVRVFELSQASVSSLFAVLSHLAAQFRSARSPFVPVEIIDVSRRLMLLQNAPYENIYLSLSASHWKHAFIEIYRVLEGLYYFGWMHGIKQTFGGNYAEYDLYLTFQDQLSWKYKERASIVKLFEIVPRGVLSTHDPVSITSLSSCFENQADTAVMNKFAHLIYSIRNSNVHQGESDDGQTIEISADCWPKLTYCLFLIVEHLYSVYQAGMPRPPTPQSPGSPKFA
ncbi:hypothetical protein ACJVQT_19265 [Enterobacter huaxiensis]|uniref:hypothetical protein n=1 Tax=Enterobacter huaxiensis TaxID=2494702 RepID=UPI0021760A63|nr:hypothetical protein [Enterobacter huaxiensis]MCS5451502.1 hypothetical protein [Enterobacter huaxiensis]